MLKQQKLYACVPATVPADSQSALPFLMTLRIVGLIYVVALVLAVEAAHDYSVAVADVLSRQGTQIVLRSNDPDDFENLMTYQWIRCFICLGIGAALHHIILRADQLDPFSPGY